MSAQNTSDSVSAFPNPFSQRTLVKYTLANNDTISIRVYNIAGMLVVPLVIDSMVAAGAHQDTLIMDNFQDGVYFVLLFNRQKMLKNTKIIKSLGTPVHRQNTTQTPVLIFPNPVKDKVSLIFPEHKILNYKAWITNSQGQSVSEVSYFHQEGDLDLSALREGVYHLHIQSGFETSSLKLIKE